MYHYHLLPLLSPPIWMNFLTFDFPPVELDFPKNCPIGRKSFLSLSEVWKNVLGDTKTKAGDDAAAS